MSMNTQEFVHIDGKQRMGAYKDTELYTVLFKDPEWRLAGSEVEADGGDEETRRELEEARERIATLEAERDEADGGGEGGEKTETLPDGVTAKGGGWFELPDGSSVRRDGLDEWVQAQETS
jgi:hypothetical protein